MDFFGLGVPELILIVLVLLLFFGKDRLPGLARSIGVSIKELKSGFNSPVQPTSEDKNKEKNDVGSKEQK